MKADHFPRSRPVDTRQPERMAVRRAGALVVEHAEGIGIPGPHAGPRTQFHTLSCPATPGRFPAYIHDRGALYVQ